MAGDDVAVTHAMKVADQSDEVVRQAASFYVEQILLAPEADSYRVLGATPDATIDELRRNMALLLRWLHPDREANSARALFASRVTQAWNDVKTAERRHAYDAARNQLVQPDPARDPRSTHHAPTIYRRPGTASSRAPGHRVRRSVRRPKSIWRYLKHLMSRSRD